LYSIVAFWETDENKSLLEKFLQKNIFPKSDFGVLTRLSPFDKTSTSSLRNINDE